ncbi:Hypothetical protein RG1141_PA07270 (plasmid) [Neorhizobium galegae bv. officinalis bv. officinalis str. HAMBI 1141]|uniref:Luciferase-like domain-containing protein n=1 Tax=Neorhizobium galegae bv. officinalis bv. officinalis str. HAMBI 1141 TaxID=1028801 RepID=A0A068THG0_NEOGA|nr:Hypothetical protein RG1141_PA07270 [Neorhizobium galegae bv. officinalis bv. officinalis str. HAMBI 1141]
MTDALSGGRLNVGVSAGPPLHAELVAPLVFDGDWQNFDFSYARVERLLADLEGNYIGDGETYVISPGNRQQARLQPFAKGLRDRVWYGGGSLRSSEWAGRTGLNLMIGSLTSGDISDDFLEAQARQLAAFRAALPAGRSPRVAAGRVIVPTDGADKHTRENTEIMPQAGMSERSRLRGRAARFSVAIWSAAQTRSSKGCSPTVFCARSANSGSSCPMNLLWRSTPRSSPISRRRSRPRSAGSGRSPKIPSIPGKHSHD